MVESGGLLNRYRCQSLSGVRIPPSPLNACAVCRGESHGEAITASPASFSGDSFHSLRFPAVICCADSATGAPLFAPLAARSKWSSVVWA